MKNSEKAVSNSRFHQNIRVFFSRGFMSKICFGIIIVFVVLAVLAPVLAPYPPTEQSLTEALQKPSATHWFGTDNLGRDLLSRILYGSRISLISSLLSSLIAAAIGTFLGLVAGYFGGLLSQVIMRVIDAQLSIPPLVLTIVLAMVFGGGITGVSVVIGLSMFPSYARVSYAQVLALKENDYVMAAQLVGESEVAEMIADDTTLNPMEAQMAIRQLRKVVQRLLLDGKSVKLGNWGTFNVTLSTEGADTKEALSARNVKTVNINFQPGDELKTAMQKADFVWLNKIVEGSTSTDSESPDEIDEGDDRPVIE